MFLEELIRFFSLSCLNMCVYAVGCVTCQRKGSIYFLISITDFVENSET